MPDEKIRSLLDKGTENLVAQVREVSRLLLERHSESANITSIAAAQAITHQIKGTSGSIGFTQLAAAASALDDELKTHLKHSGLSGGLRSGYSALLVSLQSAAEQTTSERSTLYNVDLSTSAKR